MPTRHKQLVPNVDDVVQKHRKGHQGRTQLPRQLGVVEQRADHEALVDLSGGKQQVGRREEQVLVESLKQSKERSCSWCNRLQS